MRLRQIFEADGKTAAIAFGRMNPPTIGHEKLVNVIASQKADPFLFVTQTQKPKTDPLPFNIKLEFAKAAFPNVTVGDANVKTIIQALQKIESMGYDNLIYVAGSDRVDSFNELLNNYNGKDYTFKSIKVISAGERDPDAEGAEGMSASKMREAAMKDNFEAFAQGLPRGLQNNAKNVYSAVRTGMGIKELEPAEQIEEQQVNEAVPLIALAMAARIGAPAIGRVLGGAAKFAAKKPVTTAIGATAAANPDAVMDIANVAKNTYNLVSDPAAAAAALAQGAWSSAKDAATGIASIVGDNLKPDAIKALATAASKYAIPAAGIIALLYGGKKLYDYASSPSENIEEGPGYGYRRREVDDEANIMYRYNHETGKLVQKMIDVRDERSAKAEGWRYEWKDALRTANIIQSKFDPKKFVQKQGDKWVPVNPFKDKTESVAEGYGRYWCSTDKKWKERKGPKQKRSS